MESIEFKKKAGNDWETHNKNALELKGKTRVFEFFDRAIDLDAKKISALSLGTGGNMYDLENILSKDYREILAVDIDSKVGEYLKNLNTEKISFLNTSIENLDLGDKKFSFITSNYTLSFLDKNDFEKFLEKISQHLIDGGIFQANIFGENDDWENKNSGEYGQNFQKYKREEVEELLKKYFSIVEIEEEEYDNKSLSGDLKHWHEIRFIVKKNEK